MATVVLKVNERSKAAQSFLEFVKTLPFVTVQEEENRYNAETEKAIEDARAGKGIVTTKNHADLLRKLKK